MDQSKKSNRTQWGGHARRGRGRRAGSFVAAALLLGAGATAIGWVPSVRWGVAPAGRTPTGSSAVSPSSTLPAPAQATTGSTASLPAPPADDWMQPYRGMTLDQAFEAVARRVRFEPYVGVQRGARGTARAQAGNALDQALLLAGILRASGHEVRLVHGSLPPENTAALLRGLYPPRVPSGAFEAAYLPYDVTADTQLAALVRDHYWLEVNQGSTWLPLDPSFPRAKVGEAYGTATDRFNEPPADLHQRVEFTWRIDTPDRASQQVATWRGTVEGLGMQPISLVVDAVPGAPGQPPPAQPSTGGVFGGALAAAAPPKPANAGPSGAEAVTAVRYARSVETNTRQAAAGNVSLLSRPGSFVRREYLEIRLTGPGGLDRTIGRTLYEAEGRLASPRAEHRRYTLLVVPGSVPQSFRDSEMGRWRRALTLDEWRSQTADLQRQPPAHDRDRTAVEKAQAIDLVAGKAAGLLMTLDFAARSDALTDRIAHPNQLAVVRALPRVLIASVETRMDESGQAASSVSLDLRLDEVQAYPFPGFPSRAVPLFLAARGMQESVLEGQLVARWTGRGTAVSTAALMAEAARTRVRLLAVTPDNRDALDEARGISPRVRAEIEAAVDAQHHVIVPADGVALAGRPRWGWWDVDPASGGIIGVMEGGQHQAMAEYSVSSQGIGINDKNAFFIGCIVGSNTTMFLLCGKLLETGTVTPEIVEAIEAYVENAACNTMCPAEASATAGVSASVAGCYTIDKFKEGMKPAIGASASLDFCSKYNDGFKCAGGLILAGLKGKMPAVTVSAEAKFTLPCGVGK